MAKLFKLEKEMIDIIYKLGLKAPYGLVYDNPYQSFTFKQALNATTDISVTYDFYLYDDKDYFKVTIFIGSCCHFGLFFKEDYEFIKSLVDKFVRLNV